MKKKDNKFLGGPQTVTGSWQLLTQDPTVHKIRTNCVVKGEGKGLEVNNKTTGITGTLMFSLAQEMGNAQLTVMSRLLVEYNDLGPRLGCSDAEFVFRYILHNLDPTLSVSHFVDAGVGVLKHSDKVAAPDKLDRKRKNPGDSFDLPRSSGIHSIGRAQKLRTHAPVDSHKRTDVTLVEVSLHVDLSPALTVTFIQSSGVVSGLSFSFPAPINTSESLLLDGLGVRRDGNHLVISWDRVQGLQRCVSTSTTIAHGSGTSSSTLKCARKVFLKFVPFFSCEHNNS